MKPSSIILLGPPGSGKGTQAARLSAELGIPTISTGEILRSEAASGSKLGRLVQRVLASGQLVSDEIMNRVVKSRLRAPDCRKGFILDGYPRTVSQAQQLDRLLRRMKFSEPIVFDFQISTGEILSRLARRWECPACHRTYSVGTPDGNSERCERDGSELVRRADDNAVSIEQRLRLYTAKAAELVRYYAGRNYHPVAAERPVAVIARELAELAAGSGRQPSRALPARALPVRLRAAF